MQVMPECFPCFINQSLRAAKFVTDDKKLQSEILKEVMNNLCSKDNLNISPAEYGIDVYRIVRRMTGVNDPFIKEKENHRNELEELNPHLLELLNSENDIEKFNKYTNLHNGLKLAGIGNIIDLGVDNPINLIEEIDRVFKIGFVYDEFFSFIDMAKKSKTLLYLTDNSGEIYFDLIFIDRLFDYFNLDITLGVKGGPVINDITLDDVKKINLDKRIKVLSNGTDAIGTILKECSTEFNQVFNTADIIISKGQANFESLNYLKKDNLFFSLKLKCEPIAEYTGFKKGDTVFTRSS